MRENMRYAHYWQICARYKLKLACLATQRMQRTECMHTKNAEKCNARKE